ncbi:hypothetical protein ALMP_38700 [Streptomyces sp. A012304]|nr:hypothetical protein ALMP_38700 [Streptomyces sp. A012304]
MPENRGFRTQPGIGGIGITQVGRMRQVQDRVSDGHLIHESVSPRIASHMIEAFECFRAELRETPIRRWAERLTDASPY